MSNPVQLELLADSASPPFGLQVKIERSKDCCAQAGIATIGCSAGPHFAELRCAACGAHRGWLSKSTAQWIEEVINKFGAPTEPIVVRRPIPAEAGSTAGESGTHEQTRKDAQYDNYQSPDDSSS
jgi:hypothetical protein